MLHFDLIKRHARRLLRIYTQPVILLCFTAFLIALIVRYYFFLVILSEGQDSDILDAVKLGAEAVVALISTFSGVLAALILGRKYKEEDDRRTKKFVYADLWYELRKVNNGLNQIIPNFNFSRTLEKIESTPEAIYNLLSTKLDRLSQLQALIPTDSFYSAQNSGAITTIDNDEILNKIHFAYENLQYALTALKVFAMDTEMKQIILHQEGSLSQTLIDETKKYTIETKKELTTAQIHVKNAITALERHLSNEGVTATIEDRHN